MDPYLDPVRQVLPDHISEHVTLIRNGTDGEEYRPGIDLKKQGFKPKYPVVVIPGFVTSGLELWSGHECAKQYFRRAPAALAQATCALDGAAWLSLLAAQLRI